MQLTTGRRAPAPAMVQATRFTTLLVPLTLVSGSVQLAGAAAIGHGAQAQGEVEYYDTAERTPGSFRIAEGTRCSEHYHVAGWGVGEQSACEALCLSDERCATFSLEATGDKGCFLFGTGAKCARAAHWTTGHRDTRCAVAQENAATTLSCPFGTVISRIGFASYGTPGGECYNFTTGSCHLPSTTEVVEDLCIGESECTLSASSMVFDDPCPIVGKELKVQVECSVDTNFNEDVYFNAWSSRHWPAAVAETNSRLEEWQGFVEALPEYPAEKFSGRGIIVVAGGRYLEPALVMIKMLRQSGCELRIQVWHVGKAEMRDVHRELLQPYDVETRDFHDFVGPEMLQPIQANVGMRLFQLKPLALLHTDLEDVLLLDSDNCPLRDPSYLFDSPEFKNTGTVFWPDYWKTSRQNPIWKLIGREPTSSWEQESGQLLLHKAAAWKAINLCVFLNSEFYMKLLNGDKDTFRFSWMAADVPFTMVKTWPTPIGTLKELHSSEEGFCSHTMLQHDLEGVPLFVHHNQLKHASLEVGENFKYQKVMSDSSRHYRAVPKAGLKLPSGVRLPCIDIQAEADPRIDGDACSVSEANLVDFERRYFDAQNSIPSSAFTARERAAPSLLASDGGKAALMHRAFVEAQNPLSARLRRDTNTTCKPTEFELVKPTVRNDRVCEPVATCGGDQIQKVAPTATSDRVCKTVKEALIKRFTVRVGDKSAAHPYASFGASEAFEIRDERAQAPAFVQALTVLATRLETYEFVMADMPTAHSFMLTLDALGGATSNPYEVGVIGSGATSNKTLSFTPSPATPSTLYYQSHEKTHVGWKVLVSDPTYSVTHSGRHAGKTDSFARFSTAFSPLARIFTQTSPVGQGNFASLRETCELQCGSLRSCKGIFIFRTFNTNKCYGLNDVSGEPTATSTDSQSITKQTF